MIDRRKIPPQVKALDTVKAYRMLCSVRLLTLTVLVGGAWVGDGHRILHVRQKRWEILKSERRDVVDRKWK
jgi:hypothetical protein